MKTFGKFTEAAPGSPPPGMYVPIIFPSLGTIGTRTRDGRLIEDGFEPFDLPRSIQLCPTAEGAHGGARPVGRAEEVVLDARFDVETNTYVEEPGNISGRGWLLADADGKRSAYLVRTQALRGNSMDLSVTQEDVDVEIRETASGALVFEATFRNARMAATTLLTTPAFEDSAAVIPEGWAVEGFDEVEAVTAALAFAEAEIVQELAADATPALFAFNVISERPKIDASAFQDPELTELTPVFVDEKDRVFGHIAGWDTPHLNAGGVTPPRSRSNYAYYASKTVLTTDGFMGTGALVIGTDHAAKNLLWRDAVDHYADARLAWADVAVGEDDLGIWFAGVVRPGTSNEQVHAGRASALSGDWRNVGGSLELVAALSVNAPGFPIPRAASFAHEPGLVLSLTGAGALPPRKLVQANLSALSPEVERNLAYLAGKAATEEARALLDAWPEHE